MWFTRPFLTWSPPNFLISSSSILYSSPTTLIFLLLIKYAKHSSSHCFLCLAPWLTIFILLHSFKSLKTAPQFFLIILLKMSSCPNHFCQPCHWILLHCPCFISLLSNYQYYCTIHKSKIVFFTFVDTASRTYCACFQEVLN